MICVSAKNSVVTIAVTSGGELESIKVVSELWHSVVKLVTTAVNIPFTATICTSGIQNGRVFCSGPNAFSFYIVLSWRLTLSGLPAGETF